MMRGYPDRDEWAAVHLAGFHSNGCSNAPDELVLSGFAIANDDSEQYPPRPCDLHDYRYWCGGDELERAEADCELYLGILMLVEAAGELHPARLDLWREQARAYWNAVRLFGAAHFGARRAGQ